MANFGQLVEKLLEGFAQGQIHNRNVAERGGDYRLKDQEAAFGKLRGMTQLTNAAEDREFVREDRGIASRQRTAAGKAVKSIMPDLAELDDETALEIYRQRVEQKKMEDEQRKIASEIAKNEGAAAESLRDASVPPKFELSPQIQEAEAQARIKAHLRGPAGPQPPSALEEEAMRALIEERQATTRLKNADAGYTGVLPPGAGVLAPPPGAAPSGCPEGKTGNKGAVVCRGGQWVTNK